jgi:hypothetical protein
MCGLYERSAALQQELDGGASRQCMWCLAGGVERSGAHNVGQAPRTAATQVQGACASPSSFIFLTLPTHPSLMQFICRHGGPAAV